MVCSEFGSRSKIAKVARVHSRLNHVVNEGRLPTSFPPSFSPFFPPTPSQHPPPRWSPTPSLASMGPLPLQHSLSTSTTLPGSLLKHTEAGHPGIRTMHLCTLWRNGPLGGYFQQERTDPHVSPQLFSLLLTLSFKQKAWWGWMDTADLCI